MSDVRMAGKRQVSLTLLSAMVVQLCNVVVALALPRLLIATYGSDLNGITSAASQFAQYLTLMETSITAATCYQFIELKKRGDYVELNNLFVTISDFYKKISIIIAFIAVVFAVGYAATAKTAVGLVEVIIIFLLYEGIYVLSYFSFYKYNFMLYADGKQYYIAFSSVVTTIISFIIKIFLIRAKVSILLILVIGICIDVIRLIDIRRKVRREFKYINKKTAVIKPAMLSEKWDSFVMSISDSVKSMVPTVCISIRFGASFVSVCSVYQTVMHVGNSIITMCLNGLLPVIGASLTEKDEKAQSLFRIIFVVVVSLSTIICTCLCGMMMYFIKIYISNSDISYTYPLLAFILVANTWFLMIRLPFDMLIKAFGRIRELRNGCIAEIIITVACILIFLAFSRFELVLAGSLIASICRTFRMMRFCIEEIGIDEKRKLVWDFLFWFVYVVFSCAAAYLILPQEGSIFNFVLTAAQVFVVVATVTIAVDVLRYPQIRVFGKNVIRKVFYK